MSKKIPKTLTPSELLEAEKNSYRLFGFTATEFTNRITGIMIDKWATIYDSHIAPPLVDSAAPEKAVKKFSFNVLSSLFQHGRFHMIFNGWKEWIAATIFHIPPNITLPEDEKYKNAADYDDQEDLDKEQAELEEHIRQLREQIEIVENERKNTKIAIQAIREYKKANADTVDAMEH
uniref:Protein MIS12 homolog n=1 Tax=Panagrolaimus sp. PS1159 TaxID=55785 RepID=A0AC35GRS1_9BILA